MVFKFYDILKQRSVLFQCAYSLPFSWQSFIINFKMGCDVLMIIHAYSIFSELALPPMHIKLPCRIGFRGMSELFLGKHFPLLNKVYSSGYDSIWAILNSTNLLSSVSDRVRYFKFSLFFVSFPVQPVWF